MMPSELEHVSNLHDSRCSWDERHSGCSKADRDKTASCIDDDDPFGCQHEALLQAGPVGMSRRTNVEDEIASTHPQHIVCQGVVARK